MNKAKSNAKKIETICALGVIGVFFASFFCGCGKKSEDKNQKLAQTYYKLCMLEVSQYSDGGDSPQTTYRKALSHIQEALKYKASAEFFAVKATILFRLGDFEQSCQNFEQALACDDACAKVRASILNNYACLLAQMGKADRALDIFDKLAKDSDYFTPQAAVFNKGKIFFDKQNYEYAVKEFSQAVALAPEYVDAHYFLALAAFNLKNITLTKREIETVLFLEPAHEGAIKLSDKLIAVIR
jgi:tetratricopeptide (TPR) repeat protein